MKKLESLKNKKFDKINLSLIRGGQGREPSISDCTTLNLTKVRATGEIKREADTDDSDWAPY